MKTRNETGALPARAIAAFALLAMAIALMMGFAPAAYAEGSLSAAVFDDAEQVAPTSGEPTYATLTTDAEGQAHLTVAIDEAGVYSIRSTASQGVDGDTIGYLYDGEMNELEVSDDCHADTNFGICTELAAGTYYLTVTGKEIQPNASITVCVQQGQALGSLDYRAAYDGDTVSSFELGTGEHGEKTEWAAADAAAYEPVGYVERSVFIHAQESGAVDALSWSAGLPAEPGRFAVMVAPKGDAYAGNAYFFLDERADSSSIAELDPVVSKRVCGAVSAVELGRYTTVPTNWSSRWDAITAGYYNVVGYCDRSKFEALGCDDESVTWTSGTPRETGSYVVKCQATDLDENPYTGSTYVWTQVGTTSHAGSGTWTIDKAATFTTAGQRHLTCTYCGAPCDYSTISALSNSTETAGSGATAANYHILSTSTASYDASLVTGTAATVPDTVSINGMTFKVVSVADGAFAGKTNVKTVKIGKNVTTIGKNAFKNCKNLTSVTIGAAVTTIGDSAFQGCVKLKTVKLGKKVATIGKSAFAGCKVMTSFTVTAGVKTIGAQAFKGCKKLKTLTLKTKKLTKKTMKNCLKGSSVTTVKAPKAKKKAYAKLFVKKIAGKKATVK